MYNRLPVIACADKTDGLRSLQHSEGWYYERRNELDMRRLKCRCHRKSKLNWTLIFLSQSFKIILNVEYETIIKYLLYNINYDIEYLITYK